jgi:hypothetical protein
LDTAVTAGPIAKGIDDVGASQVAGAGTNHAASDTTKGGARRAASAGASRGSEKTSVGRSSRRAAASAA